MDDGTGVVLITKVKEEPGRLLTAQLLRATNFALCLPPAPVNDTAGLSTGKRTTDIADDEDGQFD